MENTQSIDEEGSVKKKKWITPELILLDSSDINAAKNRPAYREATYQSRVNLGFDDYLIQFDKGQNPVPASVVKTSYIS